MRKFFLFLFFIFFISFTSAEIVLHTPQIITVTSSDTELPVSFFNDGKEDTFNAVFVSKSDKIFASIETKDIVVSKDEYGAFNLKIDADSVEPGVYFGEIIISSSDNKLKKIVPVIVGIESDLPRAFDVSIELDEDLGISYVEGELKVITDVSAYKLDYNPTTLNKVVLSYYVYDLNGKELDYSEEIVSISTRSSFTKVTNLGDIYPSEVVFVALVRSQGKVWLDILQTPSSSNDIYLSPEYPNSNYWIYLTIFSFLIASIIVMSYFWNHRNMVQANEWQSKLQEIKKYQFSDSSKALRKLASQKEVLQRAYSSKFITKQSYLEGISSINKMSENLKKKS